MSKLLKKYQKVLKDFIYSFFSYALPSLVLQFVVQPLVASSSGASENGLFLTLFNVIKLCVGVLIVPLANIRLLDKKECKIFPMYDKGYNAVFAIMTILSLGIAMVFLFLYQGPGDIWDYLRLLAVVLLLCAHDFYAIAFRIDINYRLILIDNLLIIVGYALGILAFLKFGHWEYIFISGYILGLIFVLLTSKLWRSGVGFSGVQRIIPKYHQLCASAGLNNVPVYCDKLLIYPMLGGYAVSVYNAAAVVSKAISLISVPVRNVLLSYIVDEDQLVIYKKDWRKALLIAMAGMLATFMCFYFASEILGRLLYPQFIQVARRYIPIILIAVILETLSNVLKTILLRFAKVNLQIEVSAIKTATYLISVFILAKIFDLGLLGFCLAILLTDSIQFLVVLYSFLKRLVIEK